jgi:hypothetical protein
MLESSLRCSAAHRKLGHAVEEQQSDTYYSPERLICDSWCHEMKKR